MILFSVIATILFIWNLMLLNKVRVLRSTTKSLTDDIRSAAGTCGVTIDEKIEPTNSEPTDETS